MATLHEKAEFNTVSYETFTFFVTYWRNIHFFEKYVRIKIENSKILVLISKILLKFD